MLLDGSRIHEHLADLKLGGSGSISAGSYREIQLEASDVNTNKQSASQKRERQG